MKTDIISFFILLLGFVSISVAVEPGLQSDVEKKFSDEFEADRPKEIQELEERFEDGLDAFIKQGLQDFKDIASDLKSNANEKKPLFKKIKCLFCMSPSSSTESDSKEKFVEQELATHLENFKVYFKSIRGLNNGLMDQLKEVFNKIITVSFDKPIEPEKEIGMLSISDENNMQDIKKTLIDFIPIISQAMTCRFKVVYAVNWIRVRLDYIKNKVEWMTLREELVKLKQTYDVIERNLNEYLTSFNEMVANPHKRDDSKVKKVTDYFKETIEEGKFISITEEIIEKIEGIQIKRDINNNPLDNLSESQEFITRFYEQFNGLTSDEESEEFITIFDEVFNGLSSSDEEESEVRVINNDHDFNLEFPTFLINDLDDSDDEDDSIRLEQLQELRAIPLNMNYESYYYPRYLDEDHSDSD